MRLFITCCLFHIGHHDATQRMNLKHYLIYRKEGHCGKCLLSTSEEVAVPKTKPLVYCHMDGHLTREI